MSNYRLTALLVPAALLLVLPAFAAYPWQIPLGSSLALPFLLLLTILFAGLRYPALLPSPLVFLSGLLCDLFTRSPLGFWTFLALFALLCTRIPAPFLHNRSAWLRTVVFAFSLVIVTMATWALASLYQLEWQEPRTTIDGLVAALFLLPVPALLFIGVEKGLILKKRRAAPRIGRAG